MPRTLKRRSDVITNDASEEESPEPPTQQRRHSLSNSSAGSSDISISPDPETQAESQTQSNTQTLIKKLVRLALSSEYSRLPLRRTDISQKILKDSNASHKLFKPVFEGAQKVLQRTFGMTLMELPSREKTTLKDRRTQATQTQKSQQTSVNKAWILVSTLPKAYKQNVSICPPSRASSQENEAEYTALYTFVVSLIYLNNSILTDAKLERYLKRMNADSWTPVGATDKALQKMTRDGYIEKRRDTSTGEEVVEWVVGPRGKIEVGVRGVASLVQSMYGHGVNQNAGADHGGEEGSGHLNEVKIEKEELDRKLERSLGIKLSENGPRHSLPREMEGSGLQQEAGRPRTGSPQRNDNDSDE